MARCESCAKFVSLETSDPELMELSIDENGHITADVHLDRNCADCGSTMKCTDFCTEDDIEHTADAQAVCELSIDDNSIEVTEFGGGRYEKNLIGFKLGATVTCKCGWTKEVEVVDSIPASHFDEC